MILTILLPLLLRLIGAHTKILALDSVLPENTVHDISDSRREKFSCFRGRPLVEEHARERLGTMEMVQSRWYFE